MLVHHRVTPSSMSLVPIYTPGWREAMWGKVSRLRKQHDGREPTFRSKVKRAGHYTTGQTDSTSTNIAHQYWRILKLCFRCWMRLKDTKFEWLPSLRVFRRIFRKGMGFFSRCFAELIKGLITTILKCLAKLRKKKIFIFL